MLGAGAMLMGSSVPAFGQESPGPSGSGADGVVAAEQAMREAMAPIRAFPGPTTGPAAQSDKSVVLISCGMSSEGCARPIEGAAEAAEALGWEATICDGNFDPTRYEACINTAITTQADGIYMQAIAEELVRDALARAREAGITVVSTESRNPTSETGVNFEVDADWEGMGRALGNFYVWRTDGNPVVMLQYERAYRSGTAIYDAIKEVVEAAGGSTVDFEFSEADLTTDYPTRTVAELRANPDINGYVNFDDGIIISLPAVRDAGLLDGLYPAGWSLIGASLESIRNGEQAASIAAPQAWEGWAAMDTLNRIFAGEEPVDQHLPYRLITAENVGEVPAGESWDGDVDYRAEYQKIWSGTP
jgi:ABC-type sugar transport system substrate-binding protein